MEFEWDPAKEAKNLEKHGISFVAAARALSSGTTLEFQSDRSDEPRWVAVGRYRIISARRARKNEEEEYRKHVQGTPPGAEDRTGARPGEQR